MAVQTCSVTGCHRPRWARGWCGTHYRRWHTTGSTADPVRPSDLERYLSKVGAPAATGCREWADHRDKNGYGRFTTKAAGERQSTWVAHRFGYMSLVGPIPDGMVVKHLCNNKACQEPSHWEIDTPKGNTRDAWRDGLCSATGERNGQAKLTDADVIEIRRLHFHEGISGRQLGFRYGVSRSTITQMLRGETWAHVTGGQ